MTATSDLKRAVDALAAKQGPQALCWRYYAGDHPLKYATLKLSTVFRKLTARWCENWCAVVCDALLDRLDLSGFTVEDEAAQQAIEAIWDAQQVDLDAGRIHKSVAVTGEGFLIVEQAEAGGARMYANRPHLVHAFYREDDPKRMDFAAKWWSHEGRTRLTLYYPDRFEHYVADAARADVTGAAAFAPDPELPEESNPWGIIPVFHFCADTEDIRGELSSVIPLNDAINKLLADMMVSAEFGAFKQRYIVSNADTAALKNGPNEVWEIPAGDKEGESTQVGSFDATELANFIGAMDNLATKIAVITRTPKHYLLQAGDVSGEALLAMEAPLVRKARKYASRMASTWRDAMVFALVLSGIVVAPEDVSVVWEDARTIQPLTEAQTRKTNVEAGIPLATQLRAEGWSEAELRKLAEDQDEAEARATTISDVAVDRALREFDQGVNAAPYPAPGAKPPAAPEPPGTGVVAA